MSFRSEHPIGFSSVVAICVTVILAIICLGKYMVESQKISAEKAVKETEILEKQATERTEERSQFWQKLVPWGKDEKDQD